MKKTTRRLAAALAVAGAFAASATQAATAPATFLLPTPENNSYATYGTSQDSVGVIRDAIYMNGIPIAFKYDNYWSYSAHTLDAIQTANPTWLPTATFGTYDFSVGTGTIAVNITSNAGGATNVPYNVQDPVNLTSSTANVLGWTSVWGKDPQTFVSEPNGAGNYTAPASSVGGTTTVGNLLNFLHILNPLASIPVFFADYNQTGSGDSLWMTAMVQIIDPTSGNVVAQFNLDATNGSGYNAGSPTYNYGDVDFLGNAAACAANPWNPATGVGCAGVTANGDNYTHLDHNKGSGAPDFLAYAPTLDLTLWDPSFLFAVTIDLGCVGQRTPYPGTTDKGCQTNGGEEFGIVGAVGRQVPEPGALALLAVGLSGLALIRRRRDYQEQA